MPPPVTARIALSCINDGHFDDAVGVYLAYNSYSLFDRMRVRDRTAHVVAAELDDYLLSGLSLDQIAGVRSALSRFRDADAPLHAQVCGALWKLGPPEYIPDYMIWRGEMPLKTKTDWQVPEFDAASAWLRAVGEFNRCSGP